jgi:hypothetical protein
MGYVTSPESEIDFEQEMCGGKVSRCFCHKHTKETWSPWRPPTAEKSTYTTINHYIRLALRLAVAVMWVGGARNIFLLVKSHISSDTLFSRFWVSKMQFLPLISTKIEFRNLPFCAPEYLGVV